MTADWAVINVQGPSSLALLRRLVPEVAGLQFSRSVEARLGEARVRLLRLSYVGELGYEVHVPRAEAGHVLDTLLATAEAVGQEVTLAGMEAMESLALEAGYRHWPSDISQVEHCVCMEASCHTILQIDTPLEAGLGWVCSKTKQFRGQRRMQERRRAAGHKSLVCLSLEPGALVLGSEPILCDGDIVGYVRRSETGRVIAV